MAPGPAGGAGPRLLLVVHQFFPQFRAGTETLAERTARAFVAMGYRVDVLTSILADAPFLPAVAEHPALPPEARALLARAPVPLAAPVRYDWAEGIEVHAFTHSHDPRHGIPRFRRELAEPAIEAAVAELLARHAYARAIVFHQLHMPDRALSRIAAAGLPITFVATDFFAACPIGSLRLADGRACPGPGMGSVRCVRHLSDLRGPLRWWQDNLPRPLFAALLWAYRVAGPWPRLPVHPHQNLWHLLARNQAARRFLESCETIVAPSTAIARSLETIGARRSRILRMPYGLPEPAVLPPPRPRAGEVRLCFAGAITPRKGLHVLLDALDRLPADLPRWSLEIWGEFAHGGDYAREMAARIAGLGPGVRAMGTFESGAVHEVLGRYDYIVMPATWAENLPLLLLSALQIPRPVIIAEAAGLLEAFPDGRVFGRSFPMGDAAALARVLAEEIRARPAYDPARAPRPPGVADFALALLGRGRADAPAGTCAIAAGRGLPIDS